MRASGAAVVLLGASDGAIGGAGGGIGLRAASLVGGSTGTSLGGCTGTTAPCSASSWAWSEAISDDQGTGRGSSACGADSAAATGSYSRASSSRVAQPPAQPRARVPTSCVPCVRAGAVLGGLARSHLERVVCSSGRGSMPRATSYRVSSPRLAGPGRGSGWGRLGQTGAARGAESDGGRRTGTLAPERSLAAAHSRSSRCTPCCARIERTRAELPWMPWLLPRGGVAFSSSEVSGEYASSASSAAVAACPAARSAEAAAVAAEAAARAAADATTAAASITFAAAALAIATGRRRAVVGIVGPACAASSSVIAALSCNQLPGRPLRGFALGVVPLCLVGAAGCSVSFLGSASCARHAEMARIRARRALDARRLLSRPAGGDRQELSGANDAATRPDGGSRAAPAPSTPSSAGLCAS